MQADSTSPPARVRAGGTVLSLIAGPSERSDPAGPSRGAASPAGPARTDRRRRADDPARPGRQPAGDRRARATRAQWHALHGRERADRGRQGSARRSPRSSKPGWRRRPQGPIALGSEPAKGAIRALVGAWGSTMLRALAARPPVADGAQQRDPGSQLSGVGAALSAMRAARQVELRPEGGRGAKPYGVTEWTRQAVGPLTAAGRCECEHLAEVTEPLTRIDIEAAFLLSVPLVDLDR